MQTSTHETTPRSTSRAPSTRRAARATNRKPIYPDFPKVGHRLFWLAAYLRGIAEADALDALHTEAIRRKRSIVACHALSMANIAARDSVKTEAEYTRRDGLLLFAHNDTTVFTASKVPA